MRGVTMTTFLLFTLSLTLSTLMASDRLNETTISNITKNQIFAPPIVISQGSDFQLIETGMPAAKGLALMAEDDDAVRIDDEAMATDRVLNVARAEGTVEQVMPLFG
jgi:hypothetical protein